jgi:hypothetical protein
MSELRMLLKKYPVKINADHETGEVVFDPGFRNRAIKSRVRELFYGDDEVYWYLREMHPDSVITGENCLVVEVSA